jgi:hypothetical protein
MIRRLCAMLLASLLAACAATTGPSQAEQLAALRTQMATQNAAIDATEQDARNLTGAWADVTTGYERAAYRYAQARGQYDAATTLAQTAGANFAAATAEFNSAATMWRFYRALVYFAASVDASNLQAARAAGHMPREVDCQPMSTAQYRRVLERRGVDLTGKDIDHIVPHALGGADDVSNYEVLDSSVNRSIGAMWGADKCEIAGIEQCALAAAISRQCGAFAGPMPW